MATVQQILWSVLESVKVANLNLGPYISVLERSSIDSARDQCIRTLIFLKDNQVDYRKLLNEKYTMESMQSVLQALYGQGRKDVSHSDCLLAMDKALWAQHFGRDAPPIIEDDRLMPVGGNFLAIEYHLFRVCADLLASYAHRYNPFNIPPRVYLPMLPPPGDAILGLQQGERLWGIDDPPTRDLQFYTRDEIRPFFHYVFQWREYTGLDPFMVRFDGFWDRSNESLVSHRHVGDGMTVHWALIHSSPLPGGTPATEKRTRQTGSLEIRFSRATSDVFLKSIMTDLATRNRVRFIFDSLRGFCLRGGTTTDSPACVFSSGISPRLRAMRGQ